MFDPYLDTLGGGEKYILTAASCFSKSNEVFLFWDDPSILTLAKHRFSIDLEKIKTISNIFSPKVSSIKRLFESKKYDIIIYLSDGSMPFLLSKKNFVHFQFPVNWVHGKDMGTQAKLKRINKIICNSKFVKRYIDKTFKVDSDVLYPPVDIEENQKKYEKENIILTVGRFTKGLNVKKQDILIDVFKKNYKKHFYGWNLVVIGSVLSKDQDFVSSLKEKAKTYPIKILENVSFEELKGYYQKSKIYWHATGFGEDLKKNPERAEHFGISTVEAMGYGAVPIVINAGGLPEIVEDGENGFLWNTLEELIDKSTKLISGDELRKSFSNRAIDRSRDFSRERFCGELRSVLE